ncbi:MAG TPA: hypothetical protein DD716_04210 [Thiomicrospira sp.]|nr:hypothetical protein [Thiomicrospira sp.]
MMADTDQTPQPKKISPATKEKISVWWKRIIVIGFLLPVFVLIGIWLGLKFVDLDSYKPDVEQVFLDKTGHQLSLEGPIKLNLFPFNLNLSELKVLNLAGFNNPLFAEIESVDINLSLWQFFISKKIIIEAIELEKAKLYLEVNQQGQENWQGLLNLAGLSKPSNDGFFKVSNSPSSEPASRLNNWQFKTLISQNAAVFFVNQQKNYDWQILDFDFIAFDILPDTPFNIVSELKFANSLNDAKYHFKLSNQLNISKNLDLWKVSDWRGSINISLADEYKVPSFLLTTHGKQVILNLNTRQLSAENVAVDSQKGNIATSFEINFLDKIHSQGKINSEKINFKKWFRNFGINYPDFVKSTVLNRISFSSEWQQTEDEVAFKNLDVRWDDTVLTGKVLLQKTSSGENRTLFDMTVNEINLDLYQAKVAKVTKKEPLVETYLPLGLPIRTLKKMNVEGNLQFGSLRAGGLKYENVNITVFAEKGIIDFAPLDAQLYGGNLTSKLRLDVTGKTPAYNWSGKVKQLELKPFLKDGWSYSRLDSKLNARFNFKTKGVNSYFLKQNLAGTFNANTTEGQYLGVNLIQLLKNEKANSPKYSTQFTSLKLRGKINEGVFRARKFNLTTKEMSAIGVGMYDLNKNWLDGSLHVTLHSPPEYLQLLKGSEVPIRVKGLAGKAVWTVEK